MPTKPLFAEFAPTTRAAWLSRVAKDLKGKPNDALLGKEIADGVAMDALYMAEDTASFSPLANPQAGNGWEIGETIVVTDPIAANHTLLHALAYGVNSPRLLLSGKPSLDALTIATSGVEFSWITTHFATTHHHAALLEVVVQLLDGQTDVLGTLNYNPFAAAATMQEAAALVRRAQATLPSFQVLLLTNEFEGDHNVVDEVATLLAQGSQLYFELKQLGIPADTVSDYLQLEIHIGTHYFINIAKIRALKHLWAIVADTYGAAIQGVPRLTAVTATIATDDVHTNMIRATTQAMAAVIGGVDTLIVSPADAFQQPPTPFTTRIARNVQHILQEEAHLQHVADPARGSYYLEQLTRTIATKAWAKFQAIERGGGWTIDN